jgi:hypothetical protein
MKPYQLKTLIKSLTRPCPAIIPKCMRVREKELKDDLQDLSKEVNIFSIYDFFKYPSNEDYEYFLDSLHNVESSHRLKTRALYEEFIDFYCPVFKQVDHHDYHDYHDHPDDHDYKIEDMNFVEQIDDLEDSE